MKNFNETLRQLANVEQDINLQQAQLLVQQSSLDSQREELAKARKERQLALAKLNDDVKARDQKLQAREQDQADLARVLKTIEETLARQAREAEEARQKALCPEEPKKSQREAHRWPATARVNRHVQPPAHWFPAPAQSFGGPFVSGTRQTSMAGRWSIASALW